MLHPRSLQRGMVEQSDRKQHTMAEQSFLRRARRLRCRLPYYRHAISRSVDLLRPKSQLQDQVSNNLRKVLGTGTQDISLVPTKLVCSSVPHP